VLLSIQAKDATEKDGVASRVSIGITAYHGADTMEEWLDHTGKALSAFMQGGCNKITIFQPQKPANASLKRNALCWRPACAAIRQQNSRLRHTDNRRRPQLQTTTPRNSFHTSSLSDRLHAFQFTRN
jgi:hypothetical protein